MDPITWMAQLPWERWHLRLFAWLRIAAGVWLLILAAILLAYHVGGSWPPVLVVLAALSFYVAYRLPRAIKATKTPKVRFEEGPTAFTKG